jgi:hypothetical protein
MHILYALVFAVALLLVLFAGMAPILLIPVALVIGILLVVPIVTGAARKMGTPPPGAPVDDHPGTADASYDPASGPPR